MNTDEIIIEIVKIAIATGAAAFTYFRFFREGEHRQRIQFDIDLRNLGLVDCERVIEIGCTAANVGNVEQQFDEIRVTVRALSSDSMLCEVEGHEPRLSFPVRCATASLIPKKYEYFFVRPKVEQRFPLVIRVSSAYTHLHVRSTFKYKDTNEVHSAERAFRIEGCRAA